MERNCDIEYLSTRQFVKKYPIFSERTLRKMIAGKEIPGVQTAKAFKINVPLFLAQIDAMSLDNAAGGAAL